MNALIAWSVVCITFPLTLHADNATLVIEAARKWAEAVSRQDRATLDVLLGDDLTISSVDGTTIQDKVQYIESITTGVHRYDVLTLKELIIKSYGNAAVLSALVTTKNPEMSEPNAVRLMQLYVESDEQWRLVASAAAQRTSEPSRNVGIAGIPATVSDDHAGGTCDDSRETAAVRAAAVEWTRAMVDKDATAIEPLLLAGLLFGHSSGGPPRTRAQQLSLTKTNSYEGLTLSGMCMRVYGDIAVLRAYIDTKNIGRDPFRVLTLQVFVKAGGRWQLGAFQSTRVVPSDENGKP